MDDHAISPALLVASPARQAELVDVTPKHADGRLIGAVVMLTGIGFLAVITASVTASLIESSRRRFAESEGELARQLQKVSERLVTIEALLAQPTPSESSDGVS